MGKGDLALVRPGLCRFGRRKRRRKAVGAPLWLSIHWAPGCASDCRCFSQFIRIGMVRPEGFEPPQTQIRSLVLPNLDAV